MSGDFSSFELGAPAQPPAAALLKKSTRSPCSPNQQLTTFLLDPPFSWVVHHPHTRHYRRVQQDMAATPERLQVRSPSLRHLAAIASGEHPGPTSFESAPLLPFCPTTPGPPAGKRSRRSFGSGKASFGTPHAALPENPRPSRLADAAVSSKCTLQSKSSRLQQALILRVVTY